MQLATLKVYNTSTSASWRIIESLLLCMV